MIHTISSRHVGRILNAVTGYLWREDLNKQVWQSLELRPEVEKLNFKSILILITCRNHSIVESAFLGSSHTSFFLKIFSNLQKNIYHSFAYQFELILYYICQNVASSIYLNTRRGILEKVLCVPLKVGVKLEVT